MDYNINILIGKTLTDIVVDKEVDEILFHTADNETYKMYHWQD